MRPHTPSVRYSRTHKIFLLAVRESYVIKGVFAMKKKIIGALLCLAMVLSLFTTAFANDDLPAADPQETAPNTGTLTIEKKVEGVTPAEDWSFTFTIKSTDERVADQTATVTVKKGAQSGKAEVKDLPFGAYTITENLDNAQVNGYTLAAVGPQTAALTKEKSAAVSFTNTYTKQYSLDLSVTKKVIKTDTSEDPGNAEFTFKAYLDQQEVGTLTLKTTAPGRYEGKLPIALTASQLKNSSAQLTIQEVNSGAAGWKYDGAVYTLTVAVVNDQLQIRSITVDGKSYDAAKALAFTGTYDFRANERYLNINLTKSVIQEKNSTAPDAADFVFKAYLNNQVVGTATIKTNGVNSYAGKLPVVLTTEQLANGPVKLTVSEEKVSASGWTSDKTVYTLTVALVNDQLQITDIRKSGSDTSYGQGDKSLEFTNTYFKSGSTPNPRPTPKPDDPKKPDSPKTGDAGILLYAATALTALGGGVMLVTRKRRTAR